MFVAGSNSVTVVNPGCPTFIGQYRFGGGSASLDGNLASRDTRASDPNALDIIGGPTRRQARCDGPSESPATVLYVLLQHPTR